MPIHYETARTLSSLNEPFAYTERDTMLYALGVGMGADPMNRAELPYVYEKGLIAMPTQASVAAWGAGRLGDVGINYLMVVHGEQRLTLHRPLSASAELLADWRIVDLIDKGAGKGALVVAEIALRDKADGQLVCTLGSTIFARADGGFGGPTEGGPAPHPTPERAPDKMLALSTRPDQALLYRLSGDRNPLHSDPDVATVAGFPRPILHGLCTYGVTCRAVLQSYCDYDATAIAAFDVRFSAPVFPGETIVTRMWKDGDLIAFDAVVEERGVTVIKNGRCVLRG